MTERLAGDDVMLRQAARRIAVQAAALAFAGMLVVVSLVTVVVERGQNAAANALLRTTISTADDVGDPPPGTWLVLTRQASHHATPGIPAALSGPLAVLRTHATSRTALSEVSTGDDRSYRVATRTSDGTTAQVVLDLATQHEQRSRLLTAMVAAIALGLALAAALGIVVGRRAVRPLGQALTLQRTFIADASHELRTPLTLLSTRAQVLDREVQGSGLSPQARADSRGVVDDVLRLGEVVEDLLVAADPRGPEVTEPVALGALTRAVIDAAAAHAAAVGVTLRTELPEDVVVQGRPVALRRAVLSLVDNAIDHTPQPGEVVVRLRRERKNAVLSVSDTGPGLEPGEAKDVLKRFHSGGHRAGRAHYGLGLALTRDVANRHGGQLRLAASPVGATFEMVLPTTR